MLLTVAAVLFALLGFCFVIVIHELGHFLFAKWAGVKVLAFSVGFGKPLWKKQIGETEYRISWLWAGGYVRMLGELDATEGQDDPRSYEKAKPGWKALILLGGVLFNLVSSWVLLVALALWGMPLNPPVVGRVEPKLASVEAPGTLIDSPAMRLGLRPGDEVRSINGVRTYSFEDVFMQVGKRGGEPLTIVVRRDGEDVTLDGDGDVAPMKTPSMPLPVLGISGAASRRVEQVADVSGHVTDGRIQRGWIVERIGDRDMTGLSGDAVEDELERRLGEETTVVFTRADGSRHQETFRYAGSRALWPSALGLPPRIAIPPFAGSAAAAAGLQAGDLILALNDQPVAGMIGLTAGLQQSEPGTPVRVTIFRDGAFTTLALQPDRGVDGRARLGVSASDLTQGVVPEGLEATALGQAGVQAGDILVEVTPRLADRQAEISLVRGGELLRTAVAETEREPLQAVVGQAVTKVEDDHLLLGPPGKEQRVDRSVAPSVLSELAVGDRLLRLAAHGDGHILEFIRGGEPMVLRAELPDIGYALAFVMEKVPYELTGGMGEAIAMANHTTVRMVVDTLKIIPRFFRPKAVDGIDATRALSGPIGIFDMLRMSFERWGFAAWLHLVCLIGLNLFLINLLPIPIVDGGQLVILGIETAIRRPLPDLIKTVIAYIGLALVLSLMLFVLSLDVLRLTGVL